MESCKRSIPKETLYRGIVFAHLVLEKLCKAHWVKDNITNHPPKSHNLLYLIGQTNIKFSEDDTIFLKKMNDFQLEGRYPDYKEMIYKIYKKENTKEILTQVNTIRTCLLKKLQ